MQNRPKPVFALLPARVFGLRFALPADFDVAAGSDDLVAGSSRNERIQSDAAGIFCDMLLSEWACRIKAPLHGYSLLL